MRCKVHKYSIYSIYSPKIIASLQAVMEELSGNEILGRFRLETMGLINMQMREEIETGLSLVHHWGDLFSYIHVLF